MAGRIVPLSGRATIAAGLVNGPVVKTKILEYYVAYEPPKNDEEFGIWHCAFDKRRDVVIHAATMEGGIKSLNELAKFDARINQFIRG